jgi:membrane protein DedA with SNARE-associated domain
MLGMAFWPFVLASIVGSGKRFYLVAFLSRRHGPALAPRIEAFAEYIGWGFLVLALCAYLIARFN